MKSNTDLIKEYVDSFSKNEFAEKFLPIFKIPSWGDALYSDAGKKRDEYLEKLKSELKDKVPNNFLENPDDILSLVYAATIRAMKKK